MGLCDLLSIMRYKVKTLVTRNNIMVNVVSVPVIKMISGSGVSDLR